MNEQPILAALSSRSIAAWFRQAKNRVPLAPADAGASPGTAAFLEDLIDACVMESGESMNYEGRMMKWGSLSGAASPDSPDLLAVIKAEGKV